MPFISKNRQASFSRRDQGIAKTPKQPTLPVGIQSFGKSPFTIRHSASLTLNWAKTVKAEKDAFSRQRIQQQVRLLKRHEDATFVSLAFRPFQRNSVGVVLARNTQSLERPTNSFRPN